jgi:hypothetical protein
MKLDRSHAGSFDQSEILVLPDVIHLERMPQSIPMPLQVLPLLGEHEPMVVVVRPVRQLQFGLMGLMLPEQRFGLRSN